MRTFTLTEKEEASLEKWLKSLPKAKKGKSGLTFIFSTGSGIGVGVEVERADGKRIDITDYDSW